VDRAPVPLPLRLDEHHSVSALSEWRSSVLSEVCGVNDTTLIEWALVGLMWILGLYVLVATLLAILDYFRDPPRWWIRRQVPDRVPDDWKPSEAKR
jgi:hypothetical protein